MTISHGQVTIACPECGNQRWMSIVRFTADWVASIITCVFCDAPDADEPFED